MAAASLYMEITGGKRLDAHIPELLSPAGDLECLMAALRYGADAVYLGGHTYGMRAAPKNFGMDELPEAVRLCRACGARLYLTCNTLPTNEQADGLPDFIHGARAAGVDALIVADIGVLMLAKRIAPELPVHISTQAGVVNYLTATELYNLGAARVVLARELPLTEIVILREKTPPALEIEAFVHGAMCVSFSGRCLLSNYFTARDGNRGECAQPCRWSYYLMEEKRPGQFFPVHEDEQGTYILNAQDLCMLEHIDKLVAAGVTCFKIEGRAKSAYYVAAVTGAYRQAIDLYKSNPAGYEAPAYLVEELRKVSHRRYSTGFYLGDGLPGQYYDCRGYVRDWEVVATVDGWKDGHMLCTERNRFAVGETLEILCPNGPPTSFTVGRMLDEEGRPLQIARHPMMRLRIACEAPVPQGAMLRRRTHKMDM